LIFVSIQPARSVFCSDTISPNLYNMTIYFFDSNKAMTENMISRLKEV
jgi:hypothetical protein